MNFFRTTLSLRLLLAQVIGFASASASASASGNQFVTYQAFVGFDAHGKVIVQTNANAPLAIPDRCGKFGKLSSAAVGLGAGLVGGSERNSFEGNTAVLTRVQTDSG